MQASMSAADAVLTLGGWTLALLLAGFFGIRELRRSAAVRRAIAARAALEHDLQLYRRIFETSLDLILVTDRRGQFIDVSPSSKAILGYEPAEMIGHVGIDFIHPDDLDPTREEMRLARRGRNTRNFECRYIHKDGRAVTLTWAGVWS